MHLAPWRVFWFRDGLSFRLAHGGQSGGIIRDGIGVCVSEQPWIGPCDVFAMTGFLGAFTTFSAFSLDVFNLIETERMAAAAGYVVVSVIGAIVALFIGVFLAKGVLS